MKKEKEREKGDLRKYFEALEKNGLTSSGSILFQNEFFRDSRNKNIFFSTRRKSKKSSKEKIEKYFSNDE